MFTLDVATEKMDKFDLLLDQANIVYRIHSVSEDKSVTTVKFKKQTQLEKAQEVLKNM